MAASSASIATNSLFRTYSARMIFSATSSFVRAVNRASNTLAIPPSEMGARIS